MTKLNDTWAGNPDRHVNVLNRWRCFSGAFCLSSCGKWGIVALGLFIWLTLAPPVSSEEPNTELLPKAELKAEYQRLTQKLLTIQTEALQVRTVVAARKDFLRKLRSSALRVSPEQQKEIHEFFRAWENLDRARKNDPELTEKGTADFAEPSKKIPSFELKMVSALTIAMQDQSVIAAKEALLESTLTAMKTLDPEVPQLIQEHKQLATELNNYPSGG